MNNQEYIVQGFVVKTVDFKEYDAIITCLTNDGLISFIAKGVNKLTSKNKACCALYAFSEFTLEKGKSNYYILTKGKIIHYNPSLYNSIDYMTCIGLVSESILTFLDDKPSFTIYKLFEYLIDSLDKFDVFTITSIFLAKIIIDSGYQLDTSSCVKCGRKDNIVFMSYNDGGFICNKCLSNNQDKQDIEYLKSIRYTFLVDEDNYYHYEFKKDIAIRIIKEYVLYLQESFGFKKLGFFDMFKQLY